MRVVQYIFWMAFLLLAGCNNPQERLQGLWKMQIVEQKDSVTGEWQEAAWMKGGTGYLHYDGSGTMSAHFVPAYPNDTTDEKVRGDYWYMAHYRISADGKEVVHRRFIHSDPAQKDEVVHRRIAFHQDTLYLFADEFNFRLKWVLQDID